MEVNTGNKEASKCRFLDGLFERIDLEIEKLNGDEKAKRSLIIEMRSYVEGLLRVLLEHNETDLYEIYFTKFRNMGFKFNKLSEGSDKMN